MRFAESEKPYSIAIYEKDLCKIDGHSALFPPDQFSECFQMFSVNPATHAQEHNTLFSLESLDSAAQYLAFPWW
jgi:hypothetical protein